MTPKTIKTETEVTTPEPTVEKTPSFAPGQKVRHIEGEIFTVVRVDPHGVVLQGVANHVSPAALEPAT